MKSETTFIIQPETKEQENALKAFIKALKLKFEIRKEDSYNPDFISKIKESKKQSIEGKTVDVKKEDLKEFLGL